MIFSLRVLWKHITILKMKNFLFMSQNCFQFFSCSCPWYSSRHDPWWAALTNSDLIGMVVSHSNVSNVKKKMISHYVSHYGRSDLWPFWLRPFQFLVVPVFGIFAFRTLRFTCYHFTDDRLPIKQQSIFHLTKRWTEVSLTPNWL